MVITGYVCGFGYLDEHEHGVVVAMYHMSASSLQRSISSYDGKQAVQPLSDHEME